MAGQPAKEKWLGSQPRFPSFPFRAIAIETSRLQGVSMERVLFELCGKNPAIRFSPYVWRIRLALARKDLPFRAEPIRFTDKSPIAASGSATVPVLREGAAWVADSWVIVRHLEKTYPEKPSLLGAGGEAFSFFVQNWVNGSLLPVMFRIICTDIQHMLGATDAAYFYETRSKRIGMPLEETLKHREANLARLKETLAPVRNVLKDQPFLSGAEALYPDFLLFGAFQWARLTSPLDLQKDAPEISAWFKKIAAAYDAAVPKLETPPLLAA
ncbi:MAG TPA: glutathione S-transferase N-terminal domain-containing protein [Sphingomonadales bacterium]|nr:glutathione S-transferase N-terminal domain-containing protein [Sphingomonadales bacterium]